MKKFYEILCPTCHFCSASLAPLLKNAGMAIKLDLMSVGGIWENSKNAVKPKKTTINSIKQLKLST